MKTDNEKEIERFKEFLKDKKEKHILDVVGKHRDYLKLNNEEISAIWRAQFNKKNANHN